MLKQSLSALAVVTLLAACASTKPADPNANANAAGANQGATAGQMTSGNVDPLKDPNNILSKRSVFFDFDSFVIKPEARPLIEAHARFLVQNPQMNMLVQGNTDERGSREYNLALGQKRADVVKQALMLLGAKESQIESVSLGEEKPRCEDRTENCYAENRRGDMLYTGEF